MRLSVLAVGLLLAQSVTALAQVDADEVNRTLQGGRSAAPGAPVQDEDKRNGQIHLQGGRGNLAAPTREHEVIGPDEPVLLHIHGRGEATLSPDMAMIHSQLAVGGGTAEAAIDSSTRALHEFVELLREEGIDEQDIQVVGMSLFPHHVPRESPAPSTVSRPTQVERFEVIRAVTVRVRDLTLLDSVLDRAASAGGITVPVVAFTSSNPSQAQAEAYRRALDDAMAKAVLYAGQAGARLGGIIAIKEGAGDRPIEAGHAAVISPDPAADGPVGVADLRYSVTLQVTWRLTR